ncbi:MAG: hypothetical protein L3J83_06710 [Proteobacteria bacterium]|nr:hypothetical protein [Pseudomonadota bacterium]
MTKKSFIPSKLKPWIDARKKHHLSHAQIQMARELGLNPRKFDNLQPTKQQTWKLSLSEFIEDIYFKHFKKSTPDNVKSIEQAIKDRAMKKSEKKKRSKMEKLNS